MSRSVVLTTLGLSLASHPSLAGPPFLTDDPAPTDRGRWEINGFASTSLGPGGMEGDTGLDINYGGAPDLQLTLVLPLSFDGPGYTVKGFRSGGGAVEFGAKYRFVHQDEAGWVPDVSFFPKAVFPTDSRFGPARPNLQLPVWAQKDQGAWTVFGGGGFQINPGPGQKNFWLGGLAVQKSVTPHLSLGGEIFGQTDDSADGGGFRTIGFAATYRLNRSWSLLASGRPAWLEGGQRGAQASLSLKFEN